MRYLITGGAGFIGSHLCEALLQQGEEVFVIDDLSTGSIRNIEHLKFSRNFHYVIDSVTNLPVLAELVDSCDIIYHLAATVGVRNIIESPVRTIENNIRGTEAVLSAAAKKRRLTILASTSEVYGKGDSIPFSEDGDLVLGPTTKGRWSYACSKAIDEFLALAYWKERKVPTIVARLFNTIGPRQTGQYGMVVPTFIKQALSGEPVTVFGDGSQSRCFTYVSDVVEWLIRLSNNGPAVGEVFNLGSTEEITILELAKKVIALTGSNSEIKFVPYSQAYEEGFEDMPRRVPDISKVVRFTGYLPKISLEEALRRIINHFISTGERSYNLTGLKKHSRS